MRLVIFSPASERSAIGRVVALASRVLADLGHDIVIVRTEDVSWLPSETHAYPGEVVPWNDTERVESHLRCADGVVHHVGNNFEFHCGSLEWLPRTRGLVCLHDFFLGHLFWAWAQNRRDEAHAILHRWYGSDIADRYFAFTTPDAFIEGTHREAPMAEWVVAMADGVLTHSGWDVDRVLHACPGPVSVAALAYDAPGLRIVGASSAGSSNRRTIVTFGQINPNKRAESVVRAIAASERLRASVEYWVVGRIEPDMSSFLTALAAQLDVRLMITGEVEDATLQSLIARADVVCCLRLPALEAASASAIEAMLYGKPVVVADTGFYRDLPGDCVLRIDPADEQQQIRIALERMVDDEGERRAIGVRAQTWARGTFTAENYAAGMLSACEAIRRARPILADMRWFADTLADWGAQQPEMAEPWLLEPLNLIVESGARSRNATATRTSTSEPLLEPALRPR